MVKDWNRITQEDQELEVHYMYMAQLQEVSTDAADSGPIFDDEPLQKVSNDDHYNVFAIESAHPEQSEPVHDTYPIEQDTQNVIIDSLDINYDRAEIDQNDDDNDLAKERVEHNYMVFHLVNGVRANCVEMICDMDFVRYVIQEIHAFMILIRILSIALPILTTLHTPHTRLTRMIHMEMILILVMIVSL
nr:hypothetical protein [Tanacetum cinerariifolium]